MLRRRRSFRVFATLLALLLPLVGGETALLQPCPVHGAGDAVAMAIAGHAGFAANSGHAMHHTMHHAMHHHASADDHDGSAPSHEHHGCCCIACCAPIITGNVVEGTPTIEAPIVFASAPVHFLEQSRIAPALLEYSRPYTTGPPSA